MALAASVVLAATTALVMLVVDRLGVRSRGGALMLTLDRRLRVVRRRARPSSTRSLELPDGQVLAVLGPSGCGQVDAAARGRRARAARSAARSPGTAPTSPACRPTSAASR